MLRTMPAEKNVIVLMAVGLLLTATSLCQTLPSSKKDSASTQIVQAVQSGDIHKVKQLLDQGVDANTRTPDFNMGDQAIEADLARKAKRDPAGPATLLMLAADKGRADMVHLLLNHHAEVNMRGYLKHTEVINDDYFALDIVTAGGGPLHVATTTANTRIVTLLLANHADVNMQDFNGDTPLIMAASRQDEKMVELLLRLRGLTTRRQGYRSDNEGSDSALQLRDAKPAMSLPDDANSPLVALQ